MIPPKPSKKADDQPKKKRQGRLHRRPVEKVYPMALIQHGWDVLMMADQLDYVTSLDVAKMFFWQEMTQATANRKVPPHRRSLRQARNAANEMCLGRLKDLGYLHPEGVPEVIEEKRPRRNRTIRREVNVLTRLGRDALKEYKGEGYRTHWTPDTHLLVYREKPHDRAVHELAVNLITLLRVAGGSIKIVLTDKKLKDYIDNHQTLLGNVYPDLLVVAAFGDELKTYLGEADRGTEQDTGMKSFSFDIKIPKYRDYLRDRWPHDPFFAGMERPQVIVSAQSWRRAENLKEATFAAGGRRAYAFTAAEMLEPPDYYEPVTDGPDSLYLLSDVWMIPTVEGRTRLELPSVTYPVSLST